MKSDGNREPLFNAAESQTPSMHGNSMRENREAQATPSSDGGEGRSGKARCRTPDMNVAGESDDPIVPAKRANKAGRPEKGQPAAESVEGRGSTKGNAMQTAACRTQCRGSVSNGLQRVREAARRDKKARFTALLHHVTPELLRASYFVQQAVRTVLEQIYEEDFIGFSYGFRPGRGCHNALDAVWVGITRKKVNWVLDADIRGFFDAIDHEWMVKFLEHRIGDRRVLRLIRKWLRAGVSEDGQWSKTVVGTPQGAVISPTLANVFLHYVFDLWAKQWRERHAAGDMIVVRYADDFITGFQHRSDAERFLRELAARLEKFGLTLHPDKTRLIEFGRFAAERRLKQGLGKPETFDFLGFTHYCGKTRNGKFQLQRQSIRKRMRATLQSIKLELHRRMHHSVDDVGRWLQSVVQGWLNYHAVPDNRARLDQFRVQVIRLWRHVIRRRSQKGRKNWPWERLSRRLIRRWIPIVQTLHPYPTERLIVTTQGKSRMS